jgi:hypothetical protein
MKEYLYQMDIPQTSNAIKVASMPEEVCNWIWEAKQEYGAHFTKKTRVV